MQEMWRTVFSQGVEMSILWRTQFTGNALEEHRGKCQKMKQKTQEREYGIRLLYM